MWKLPKGNTTTNLSQCWFPGAHINNGGGSSSNVEGNLTGDREQLASISYAWMLDRIRPFLALDPEALEKQLKPFETLARCPQERMGKKEPEGWGTWAYNKLINNSPSQVIGYALGKIDDSHTWKYDLMSSPQPRSPGSYHTSDSEATNEEIHPSAYLRQEASTLGLGEGEKYEPLSMGKGWERVYVKFGKGLKDEKRSGWKWVKYIDSDENKGIERSLWEFDIGKFDNEKSVECRLIKGSWVNTLLNLECVPGPAPLPASKVA